MNESAVLQALEKICAELDWKTQTQSRDAYTMLLCPLPADPRFAGVLFAVSKVAERLMMYVSYQLKTSKKQWGALAELTTKINFGLLGGCFEVDDEKAGIRYRDGLILLNSKVDINLLKAFVATTLRDAHLYFPAFEAVVAGQSVEKALALLEEKEKSDYTGLQKELPDNK